MLPYEHSRAFTAGVVCHTPEPEFASTEPVDRPGGPHISYVKPLVRMAGMAQDIPDFAVIGWQWVQPMPINYDVNYKLLHLGKSYISVPALVRTATQHANRMPLIEEAKHFAWHVDTSGPIGILYSSNGVGWVRVTGC